jgi:glycosyltransferase involved in cell wall biosynthesis
LNEAQNLPLVLPYLPLDWVDEVILVDGQSSDSTVEIASKLLPMIKVVMESRAGKGHALQAGYRAASGDVLIVLDGDGSHDPREIPRYVAALMEGADFVKGSRFAPGGGTTDMPRNRQFGNGVFVFLVNVLFRATFTDLCYGYHAFWKYCLNWIHIPEAQGFEIDTALYIGALRQRLRITEVPSFEGYRFYGKGKLKTIPDGFRVLLSIARNWLKTIKASGRIEYMGFRGSPPEKPSLLTRSILKDEINDNKEISWK